MDFLVEVAKGNISGHTLIHKFGQNSSVPSNAWELIAKDSSPPFFRSSPSPIRLRAGGTLDDVDGPGAQSVTIEGLNDRLKRIGITVPTSGSVAGGFTDERFWRVDRAYVEKTGDYDRPWNADRINIEDDAGNLLLRIEAEESQTQYCIYSIPKRTRGYLLQADITVDSTQPADVRLFTRVSLNMAPGKARRLRHFWDGVLGAIPPYSPNGPNTPFRGPADIWMEAKGKGGVTQVTASFELLLVEDDNN